MEKGIKKRKNGLDALRYLCAFLVICIHVSSYPGKQETVPLIRSAVPAFFMISGYFYEGTLARGRVGAQVKRLLLLFLLACLLVMGAFIPVGIYFYGDPFGAMPNVFTAESLTDLLIFGMPGFAEPLWYLTALVMTLLAVTGAEKLFGRKKLRALIPLLLLVNLLLGSYSGLVFGKMLAAKCSRNWLFCGLPFFLLGDILRQYEERIKLSRRALFGLLLASLCLSRLEMAFLMSFGAYENNDLFLGTVFSAAFLFLLFLRMEGERAEKLLRLPAFLGRRYSLGIYICHIVILACGLMSLFYAVLNSMLPRFFNVLLGLYPVLLLVLSTAMTALVQWLWGLVRGFFKKTDKTFLPG